MILKLFYTARNLKGFWGFGVLGFWGGEGGPSQAGDGTQSPQRRALPPPPPADP